jgi:hypothetical protein
MRKESEVVSNIKFLSVIDARTNECVVGKIAGIGIRF